MLGEGTDAVLGEGLGTLFTGALLAPGTVGGAQHTVAAGERLTRERVRPFRPGVHPLLRATHAFLPIGSSVQPVLPHV